MHRHVLASLALLAVGAVAGCDTATMQAPRARVPQGAVFSSAGATQSTWSVNHVYQVYNVCNGDLLFVTGNVHFVTTVDPSGVTTIHENGADLTGTAPSGTQYRFILVKRVETSTTPPNEEIKAEYRLISQGSQPNFLFDETLDIAMTSTGPQLTVVSSSFKCVG